MTSRKSSILKPGRVREPLQDLSQLLPNNEDEETTTTTDNMKRRVSFARINKIKEFEVGAECTTLLHTPVYDERYSISSDSYQSSLCEQSTNKSTFEPSLMKTNPLNYSKVNDENVDIVEVGLVDISRAAPSPGKMSVGDSSMDITNMVSPNEYILEQTTSSECFPLNLTKNYISRESIIPSQYDDKDTLDSSSMETTEALPCVMTETILTNYETETYSPDVETSGDDGVFQFIDNPVFSDRRMSRKSEIFSREKPASKRLSDEMIDPEELGIVAPKRRSLTNDSCSDESSANIVIPQINADNLPKIEGKKSVIDIIFGKSLPEKTRMDNDEKLQGVRIENETNKCNTTTAEVVSRLNQSQEEIVLCPDDVPDQLEKPEPQSEPVEATKKISLLLESSIKFSTQIEIVSTVSKITVEPDAKNPSEGSKIKSSSDNDECVHLKNTESTGIIDIQLSQPVVSDVVQTQENTQLVEVSKCAENETNRSTKDMETTQTVRPSVKVENESNHITNDSESTRPVRQSTKIENESNHIVNDMETTQPIRTAAEIHESGHVTDDMETTLPVSQTTEIKDSSRVASDMEITQSVRKTAIIHENNRIANDAETNLPIVETVASQNVSNHVSKDMEITRPVLEETKAYENESNHITRDMEITQAVRQEMNEIISLVCSQNDSKSTEKNDKSVHDDSEVSSMVVECDLEDVLSNLKAVNITENEQDSYILHDISKLQEAGSVEIVKNSSDQVIIVTESSTENDPVQNDESETDQSNDVSMHLNEHEPEICAKETNAQNDNQSEIDHSNDISTHLNKNQLEICKKENIGVEERIQGPQLSDSIKLRNRQIRSSIADKIKKMIKCDKSSWSVKSITDEEWIFDALWNRLRLNINFENENNCEARLHFVSKEPVLGNEILKIAIGPIIRKYKPKLDKLCNKVEDVEHLLKLMTPSITFAEHFADDFSKTLRAENINLSRNKTASFRVASYKNHILVKIEVNMKILENLSLSDLTITPIIGNVDKDLIYKIFTEAGRDYDFTSKFVNTLWKRLDE